MNKETIEALEMALDMMKPNVRLFMVGALRDALITGRRGEQLTENEALQLSSVIERLKV